ncbi:hypothetical protein [Haploplasma axanthum]|uniref:Uncharacterized protein n=1 Tax=Haploplasma axanthum TaxID=29552 RepID=A0A449BCU0_HAPAX|nr:hypothetical protein [Haploplasma axanthum]VEU80264.1 Uncharacterised protein [Haploplasma axanthum]
MKFITYKSFGIEYSINVDSIERIEYDTRGNEYKIKLKNDDTPFVVNRFDADDFEDFSIRMRQIIKSN